MVIDVVVGLATNDSGQLEYWTELLLLTFSLSPSLPLPFSPPPFFFLPGLSSSAHFGTLTTADQLTDKVRRVVEA